jgi:hypothetical protein
MRQENALSKDAIDLLDNLGEDATWDESLSVKKSVEKDTGESPPNVSSAREFVWNDNTSGNAVSAANSDTNIAQQQQHLHKQEPSDDELDTIDIYFRPTSHARKGSDPPARHRTNTPSREHPLDTSGDAESNDYNFQGVEQHVRGRGPNSFN